MLNILDGKTERNLLPKCYHWIIESKSWGNLSFLKWLLVEYWLLFYLLSISLVPSYLCYNDNSIDISRNRWLHSVCYHITVKFWSFLASNFFNPLNNSTKEQLVLWYHISHLRKWKWVYLKVTWLAFNHKIHHCKQICQDMGNRFRIMPFYFIMNNSLMCQVWKDYGVKVANQSRA